MKRRNLILGGAALLFGSGATSFAAINDRTDPNADLQVLSDAGLVVRSIKPSENGAAGSPNRSSNIKLEDSGSLPDINTTSRGNLPLGYTLNQTNETNDNFAFNGAFAGQGNSGGVSDAAFADTFLVENQTGSSKNIGIAYADDSGNDGYGADVDASSFSGSNSSKSKLYVDEAQQIYEFRVGYAADTSASTGKLISPDADDSTDDSEPKNRVSLDAGGLLGVKIEYNSAATSASTGDPLYERINTVAGAGFRDGQYVDVLDKVWVEEGT